MISANGRARRILEAYSNESLDFVEKNAHSFALDLPSIFSSGEVAGYMEAIDLPHFIVSQWAESPDAANSVIAGYRYYASKFDDVMLFPYDHENSRFTRCFMGKFGYDFGAEAREVSGLLSERHGLPEDETLYQLKAKKGLYAAEAVRWIDETPLYLPRAAMHVSFVDNIWMMCLNAFYLRDFEMKNDVGIDLSGYDGPPS